MWVAAGARECVDECQCLLTHENVVFFWQQNPRLVLCEATAVVMKKGMFLLGITPLEKI